MWIERISPELVGGKGDLASCLRAEAKSSGWPDQECESLMATVPAKLLSCGCFLDRLTGIWRYEFGKPHRVGNSLIWGTHMWASVPVLFDVLACARARLPAEKLAAYLKVLVADPGKHPEYLVEMFAMLRVDASIPALYEAAGYGNGNKTIDWAIGPAHGRSVLIDAKRRYKDFLAQMDGISAGSAPEPAHDPALLFRSIEDKFRQADPDSVLQGGWIVTDIKQEQAELREAFEQMDATKVHFAILGDAQADVCLLTRREVDRPFLLRFFGVTEASRFQFQRRSAAG